MTFKELYEEVVARGFGDIAEQTGGEARIKRWLNQAYREIIDYRAWAFLEAEEEGTAPLKIEDLGHVLSAVNVTNEQRLDYATRAGLAHWDPALSSSGVATQWYLVGEHELHVYPLDSSSTIKVVYLKVPAELKEDADEPVVPSGYQGLIVDGAVIRAYRNADNFEALAPLRQEFKRELAGMTRTLRKSYDGNKLIQRTGTVNDYL